MAKKEQIENSKTKFKFYVTIVSAILGLFVLVGSIIFSMESRYATATVVAEQKVELKQNIKLTACDLLKTIQQDRKNSDIRFYQQLINQSHDKESELRQILLKFPNDQSIKRRIEYERQKQQKYRQKIDQLLSH